VTADRETPAGGRANAQNEPNLDRPDTRWPDGGVKCGVAGVRPGKSAIPPSDFKLQTSNFTFPSGNCAKRSQTWGDWGMGAKAVAVWDMARPGGETCKTNPIWGWVGRAAGTWAEREICKTNPIWPARPGMGAGWRAGMVCRRTIVQNEPNLARPEGKCAKRTQFGPAGG
jgi:hypothetical protein